VPLRVFCSTKTAMRTPTMEQAMIAGQWDRVFSLLGCALVTPRRGVGHGGGSFVRGSTSGGDDAVVDLGGEVMDGPRQLGVGLELLVPRFEVVVCLGLLEHRLAVLADHHERRQEDRLQNGQSVRVRDAKRGFRQGRDRASTTCDLGSAGVARRRASGPSLCGEAARVRPDALAGRATTSWMTQLPIVVLTGMPGVGKSTVAALLAARLPCAAHVKADALHRMILSGREWPSSGTARAREQHLLRSRNALALAANFRAAGILPIVDDVFCLPEHAQMLSSEPWPVLVFCLTADWSTVLNRDAGRGKHTASLYRDVERQIRWVLEETVTWIETGQHTAEEVADQIFGHVDSVLADERMPGTGVDDRSAQ
jgi:hypothetical protein